MPMVLGVLMLVRHPLVRNIHMHLRHRHMLWEQALTIRAHRVSVSMSVVDDMLLFRCEHRGWC